MQHRWMNVIISYLYFFRSISLHPSFKLLALFDVGAVSCCLRLRLNESIKADLVSWLAHCGVVFKKVFFSCCENVW